MEREEAKEVMKFKVTALECTSHAENRKRGRMDFPGPRKNVNAWKGRAISVAELIRRNYAFKGARLLTMKFIRSRLSKTK